MSHSRIFAIRATHQRRFLHRRSGITVFHQCVRAFFTPTAFDQDMPLYQCQLRTGKTKTKPKTKANPQNLDWADRNKKQKKKKKTDLQSILSRETLVAVRARKRFHRQMDPFMSLQIVIAVETLRTLIAPKRTFTMRRLRRCPIHRLQMGAMSAVESRHRAAANTVAGDRPDDGHLASGLVKVRQDRIVHGRTVHPHPRQSIRLIGSHVITVLPQGRRLQVR